MDLAAAQDVGRVVAGVDVAQQAVDRLVDGEEEGGVAVGRGRLVDQAVDARYESGEVGGAVHGHAAERGAQAGHEQGGGDAFAGDVADGEAERAVVRAEDVVVVAANALRGAACAVDAVAGKRGELLREEALLHFAGDLDFAVDAFAAGGFAGE